MTVCSDGRAVRITGASKRQPYLVDLSLPITRPGSITYWQIGSVRHEREHVIWRKQNQLDSIAYQYSDLFSQQTSPPKGVHLYRLVQDGAYAIIPRPISWFFFMLTRTKVPVVTFKVIASDLVQSSYRYFQ